MKKLITLIIALAALLTMTLVGASCTTNPPGTPIPTDSQVQVPHQDTAENFLKNSATFKFDGIDGSIELINAEESGPISSFRSSFFTFKFQTGHPGHGDRSGQVLAQVITDHTALIIVDIDKDEVKIATCDGVWDMITEKELRTTVAGTVISGGDTTLPDGPMDAPRTFIYQIEKADKTFVNVKYTAYPPSPAGDAARAKITLEFEGGMIEPGNHMEARGAYDKDSNTITISEEGDYIKTYSRQP